MASTAEIFKAYDIRGTVPDQIGAPMCQAIGRAVARFTKADQVLVVRDMRPTGVELAKAFSKGVEAEGSKAIDLGMASTDFLYFAAGKLDAPGAMFTASHNPAQYNGIKLCFAGARPIGRDTGLGEIEKLTNAFLFDALEDKDDAAESVAEASFSNKGDSGDSGSSMLEEYANHVRSFIDPTSLRPLKVVADTANGMGGLVVPLVMKALPFQVEILFPELDGTFPNHPADPIQEENLKDLKAAVLRSGADIGLAFDGDADRVFLVDELAEPVSGSLTTALVASSMLEKNPGATVLYNLICSKVVAEIVQERGGKGVRTKVGHSFIKEVMAETDAVFGGEHSGHYYFRDNYRADSGIIAALIVLEMLSASEMPLSQMLKPFRRYAASGEINSKVADPTSVAKAIATFEAKQGNLVDQLDGVTVERGTWWYNVRPSNTEPLLRLNVEALTKESCLERTKEVLEILRKFA